MPFPFSKAWKRSRTQRAETEWEASLAAAAHGDAAAEHGMIHALKKGAKADFKKAAAVLHPPRPLVMTAVLKSNPSLRPNSGWAARANYSRDTLLHLWAATPHPLKAPTAEITAMTDLLWEPPPPSELQHAWPESTLSAYLRPNDVDWWGNRQGLTARHGHWPLLTSLAWPLPHAIPDTESVEKDKHQNHWVDHWVSGILARSEQKLIPPEATAAARASEDFVRLLLNSSSRHGTPLARLWAHGAQLETLLEWIDPSRTGFHDPALRKALAGAAIVEDEAGSHSALIIHACSRQSPEQTKQWASLLQGTGEGPILTPLPKKTAEQPPSIARALIGYPELLIWMMEHRHISAPCLSLSENPELKDRLLQGWRENEPWIPSLLSAVESNYPEETGAEYQALKRAFQLDQELPAPVPTRKRERF